MIATHHLAWVLQASSALFERHGISINEQERRLGWSQYELRRIYAGELAVNIHHVDSFLLTFPTLLQYLDTPTDDLIRMQNILIARLHKNPNS